MASTVDLGPMLEAASVAVVGASPRPGSVGNHTIRQLIGGGFSGPVYPVNPRHREVEGIPCLDSIAAAGAVDLAVVAVPNDQLEREVESALAAGARSLAIFASCAGTAAGGETLIDRLAALARTAGVPVCGANGMGFVNVSGRLRVCGFHQPWGLPAGGIAFLSHSGSLFSAMLHNRRGLAFNLVVSTGNELATTMDEYLSYAIQQESTRAVGLFLETVRDPGGMGAALDRAAGRDVPVVALKVGRSQRSQHAIMSHSAALAGEYESFAAFASAHRVHLVDTLDELADTLEVFSSPRRPGAGGLGAVHDSGGERSLLIDVAERVGVPLAHIGEETRFRLRQVLDPGLEAENPVDAWGTGRNASDVFEESLRALASDPGVGVVAFVVDLTSEEAPEDGYGSIPLRMVNETNKPVVVLANLAGSVDEADALLLQASGVPVLRGTETGLRAIRHLLAHGAAGGRPARLPPRPPDLERWRTLLSRGEALYEADSLELLAGFGVPVSPSARVHKLGDAIARAESVGYPIALKVSGVAHKSDAGGVILNIDNPAALLRAWETLTPQASEMVVQPMAPPGVELALGIVADAQFGPVLMVAAGGTMVEVLNDQVTALPPIDHSQARAMLQSLRVHRLLSGHRHHPPADLDAVAEAVVAVGDVACHLGELIDSLDLNPLIVHRHGCVAVDALVVPKTPAVGSG